MSLEIYKQIEETVDRVEEHRKILNFTMVSVCVLTYNHEKFISRAINSILMQKTVFPYEVIICDDKSTDNTSNIIKNFQSKHPDKIRLRLARKNLYGQNINPIIGALANCSGKYIALCDGDDYWTDPLKLQKQVEFLENKKECSVCGHPVFQEYESSFLHVTSLPRVIPKAISNTKDILRKSFLPTCSVVFRKKSLDLDEFYKLSNGLVMGDACILLLLSQNGKIGFIQEIMAVHVVHEKGVWSKLKNVEQLKEKEKKYKIFKKYLGPTYYKTLNEILMINKLEISNEYLRLGQKKDAIIYAKEYKNKYNKLYHKRFQSKISEKCILFRVKYYKYYLILREIYKSIKKIVRIIKT